MGLRDIIIFAADKAATFGKRFNRFPKDIAKKRLTLSLLCDKIMKSLRAIGSLKTEQYSEQ